MRSTLLLVLISVALSHTKPHSGVKPVCKGLDACPAIDSNKINVHLIPHSHDDVGWLETVDKYYYDRVQSVISSVIPALLQDPKRRFVQVETAFFYMWWRDQSEEVRQSTIDLVNEGRLEFANGAWSANDEATCHYQSTIDQFTLGLRYVKDNLGECARSSVGWQVDAFGHSREQASLYSQMGFDSFYFARFDYRDRANRKSNRTMDLLWTGSANLGSDSNIFTSAFYTHYSYPSGLCFDYRCDDEKIVMDEDSPGYNWDSRVNDMVKHIEEQLPAYTSNNLLFTLGDDFMYESASNAYANIEKLINGFEKFNPKVDGKEINIFFSTPSCYAKAVNDYVTVNQQILDVKTDDFMPLMDEPTRSWSGFFSSKPTSKRYERLSSNLLQASKQLKAIADLPIEGTFKLEDAVGIMQHHDAITGTERDPVEKDYHYRLAKGVQAAVNQNDEAITKLLGLDKSLNLNTCVLANVSICAESSKDNFNILLYNPLAKSVSHYIQVPVKDGTWKVTGPDGEEVPSQLGNPMDSFSYITADIGLEVLNKVLHFQAKNLPALGYNVYNVHKESTVARAQKKPVKSARGEWGYDDTNIYLDDTTGLLRSITIKNVTVDVQQEIMYYIGSDADSAYMFRPDSDQRDAKSFGKVLNSAAISEGDLMHEITQTWNDYVRQTIRMYKDEDFIEFDWLVGPIDVDDKIRKDIISRFTTNLETKSEFYTDANGREMISRRRNYRETFNFTDEEPQSGNYYPIASKIVIKDDSKEFAVLTDRAQGGSSLNDGQVELMIHRGLFSEDLYETEYNQGIVARGSHYVTIGAVSDGNKSPAAVQRLIEKRKHLAPIMLLTEQDVPVKKQSFLKRELPENVHLLTLDKVSEGYLIRLEHFLEKNEDSNLSTEVTVDLTDLFTTFTIASMKEYTLAGAVPLEESSRLVWPQVQSTEDQNSPLRKEVRLARAEEDLEITLAPMQIRTFIAQIN